MDELSRNLLFDERIEPYQGYIPEGWMAKVSEKVKQNSVLDHLLMDLSLSWRTTSYTASMPAVVVKSVQSSTVGYAGHISPDSTIVQFTDAVLKKLSRKLPELIDDRTFRSRMASELAILADEVRTCQAAIKVEVPIEPMWKDFLKEHVFVMSLWSSQRVSYVAFYNAYEAFLIDCLKQLLGSTSLRTNHKEFLNALRTGFGADISIPCWTDSRIDVIRNVRHALSHAGGRVTADLKKQKHGIRLLDGTLQIFPEDNHQLLRRLRAGVDSLVEVAAEHPRFIVPVT